MQEYIGASLMIRIGKATHVGVLQKIEPETQLLVLESSGAAKEFNIKEIDEVEILGEDVNSNPDANTNANANLNSNNSNNNNSNNNNNINKNSINSPKVEEIKGNSIENAPKTRKIVDYVSRCDYKQIIEVSDTLYGPSIDEIVYSGTRGVLHLFVNIFKVMNKKFIVYAGDGIFSEIAISLARLCLIYGASVAVIPAAKTSRISKCLFYYEKSGGKIAERRDNQSIVIVANIKINKEMIEGAERVIFLGEYQDADVQSKEVIFFGVPIENPRKFTGNCILCDIGLSPQIYTKFGIKRYAPKLLQKILR